MATYRAKEVTENLSRALRAELFAHFPELRYEMEDAWIKKPFVDDPDVHATALCFMAECHQYDGGLEL